MSNVTNFKWWANRSSQMVSVMKKENGESVTIPPGEWLEQDMWVPWCDNPTDFAKKCMVIQFVGGPRYYVWQHGPAVCFSTEEKWQSPAMGVPGQGKIGGERKVEFKPNGSFVVTAA